MAEFDPRAFIRRKRDGGAHDPADVRAFVDGFVRGGIPDYQVSAWLMAAFLRGIDERETDALTLGLLHSGTVFDWTDLGRPSADKHSTGGVGDKVSLILAPLVAACGVLVPMVSGRGLGHTGGTLDKLEAIPGFSTQLSPAAMRAQLDRIGVAMVGQGADLTPGDGKLYALRDVTSTVESESFIVSSIVSKKVAEGAQAIAYDVKCGNGAFMRTREAAVQLARRLVQVTRSLGREAAALVTDMNQPLGVAAGNTLEVRESVDLLRGGGPADVRDLTLELAALMLSRCGAERDATAALARARRALESGAAWEKFVAMVEAQGGNASSVERADGMPAAPVVAEVRASRSGCLVSVDTFGLGELVVRIGGGRRVKEDTIDPRVGLMVRRRVGEKVESGAVLAELHLASSDPAIVARAASCFVVEDRHAAALPLILERID